MASVVVLAACVGGPSAGPLQVGGDDLVTLCPDPGVSTPRALAAAFVVNTGNDPVEITRVELVDPQAVSTGAAFAVPPGDGWYTVAGAIPPAAGGDPGSSQAWSRRQDAVGAVIAPGEEWQIVQAVTVLDDADARFTALRVSYVADGVPYRGQNRTRMQVDGYGTACS